jgi:hypothetical protein
MRGKEGGIEADVSKTDPDLSRPVVSGTTRNATYAQALMHNCDSIILESERRVPLTLKK